MNKYLCVYIPNETSGFVLLRLYSRRADNDEETWMEWRTLSAKKIQCKKEKKFLQTEIVPAHRKHFLKSSISFDFYLQLVTFNVMQQKI